MDLRSTGRRAAVGITTAIGIGSLAATGILSGFLFEGTTSTTTGTTSTDGTGSTSSGSNSSGTDDGSGTSNGSRSSGTDSGSGVQQSQGGGFSGRSSGS